MRIPFEEAINEPKLLKPRFDELGLNQRVILKTIYGLPLSEKIQDEKGWNELDYWAAGQGFADFDDLGYISKIKPHAAYVPQEYKETWVVAGRRAGKTDGLAAFCVAYEATLGGHEAHKRKGKPAICYQVAQDRRMAMFALHSINANLESMQFIFNGGNPAKNRIRQVTADRIDLWNDITIAVMPPTTKSVRGYDNPVAVLDEVGVWYQDSDSANPDYEIYRAISPGQATFPNAKIIGISSPWNKSGLLYKFYEAGTEGARIICEECRTRGAALIGCEGCAKARRPHKSRLVIHTTTAASTNPRIRRDWLEEERDKDPRAFERECLARFQDSLSGFLSSPLIEKARAIGVTVVPPDKRNFYVAAIDPAFRGDAFGFTVVHSDPKVGVIQDYVQRWFSQEGEPLNPGDIFATISGVLKDYGLKSVFSDQYSIEAHQFIAQQYGFSIEEVTFSAGSKAEIYGNLQSLLKQGRLRLLDDQETINELKSIEKKLSPGGSVQIQAPDGQHDDMATVIAIAAKEAVWLMPKVEKAEEKPKSIIERHIDQEAARRRLPAPEEDW